VSSIYCKTLKPIVTLLGVMVLIIAVPAPVPVSAKPLGMPTEQGLPKSLADLIEHVSPAVVNIKVVTGGYAVGRPGEDTTEGQGSGFIVTSDGKIVTNFHVIEGGDKIIVGFANGEEFPAKIIGTDYETDIAVIQIQSEDPFDYVGFYHGPEVRIGDWVLAIGNPFGIGQSSSVGIISATLRKRVESGSYVDYMQTDATVNRGNSGGPLFNFKGEVIGVNSAIFSPTGASVGIAFAVPHTLAEEVVIDLIKDGKVKRGFLGASLREAEYTQNGIVYKGGATINSVGAGSPADKAGLQVEDIILRVNDTEINNAVDATRVIGRLRSGEIAVFQIERGDKIIPGGVRVTISERPENKDRLKVATGNTGGVASSTVTAPPTPKSGSMYNTGLSLVDLGATFRESIGMRVDQVGVYVDAVALGSNAARKGLKSGMVILEADGKPVASVRLFGEIVRKAQASGKRSLVVKVRTLNGSEHFTSISLN
jgi:serine protease Do